MRSHALPGRLWCVAGPDHDLQAWQRGALLLGDAADASQGSSQVALHVVVEGLERGDVEQAYPFLNFLPGLRHLAPQFVEAPQKGRQRFARAGG